MSNPSLPPFHFLHLFFIQLPCGLHCFLHHPQLAYTLNYQYIIKMIEYDKYAIINVQLWISYII
jgi:hypothetical protein